MEINQETTDHVDLGYAAGLRSDIPSGVPHEHGEVQIVRRTQMTDARQRIRCGHEPRAACVQGNGVCIYPDAVQHHLRSVIVAPHSQGIARAIYCRAHIEQLTLRNRLASRGIDWQGGEGSAG